MKKLLNNVDVIVEQTLAGYTAAHSDVIRLVPGTHMVERVAPKDQGKVRFMMANGAGHEPAVICWVGEGMFDMNVPGDIMTCASSVRIYEAIKRLSEGGPVLVAIQNHAGDVLNAGMAIAQAQAEGIDVDSVLFYDDIASAPKDMIEERRGIGGMLFYGKILGAMAEAGATRDEMKVMFEKVRDATRTYCFAMSSWSHPVTGMQMMDDLGEDEIELGMGVHGEGGDGRMKLPTSAELAKVVLDKLLEDAEYAAGSKLLVMLNGAGSTTMMELSIFYGDVKAYLESCGFEVVGCKVGNYLTTQEMSGVSVSLCAVDDEALGLWNAPCKVSYF